MAEERLFGTPTAEQLAKINRFTKRPFKEEEVFAFDVKMIGDALISDRYIKMDKSLIQAYVGDAVAGNVAFMLNHRWASWFDNPKGVFNMGRVFDSHLAESSEVEGETAAQFGSVYIPRDREKDGVSTNEVIQSIEDGSLRDVSVGVGWTVSECSICGNDIWSSKCEHWPGRTYDDKLCYVVAKPPGDEFELSGVFAGAYPSAEVMSQAGGEARVEEVVYAEDLKRLTDRTRVMALYGRNDVHLWVPKDAIKKASFSIASVKEGGDQVPEDVKTQLEQAPVEPAETEQKDVLTQQTPEPPVDVLSFDKKRITEEFGKELTADELLQLAKDGQALKADLREDVLAWGVRADGNAFAQDTFAEMFATATVEQLKKFRESFKAKAQETLKAGRKSEPMDKKGSKTNTVPNDAYKV